MLSTAPKSVRSIGPAAKVLRAGNASFASLSKAFAITLPLIMASACGWVDSTGKTSAGTLERYQQLTGANDIVDLVGEETFRIDASRLLQDNNPSGTQGISVAGAASAIAWQRIGSGDITECPLAGFDEDGVISLRQACDRQFYNIDETAHSTSIDPACDLHILEVDGEPGVYELHAPAVTEPVALRYRLTVEDVLTGASGNSVNSSDHEHGHDHSHDHDHTHDGDSVTTVTVCLQP